MSSFNVGDMVLIMNVVTSFSNGSTIRIPLPPLVEAFGTIEEIVPMYGGGNKYFVNVDETSFIRSRLGEFYFDDYSLTKIDNIKFDVSGLEKLI